jgi:hypothetical protein
MTKREQVLERSDINAASKTSNDLIDMVLLASDIPELPIKLHRIWICKKMLRRKGNNYKYTLIRDGNLELIKWCHYNNIFTYNSNDISTAVYNGHLEIIKFLSHIGVKFYLYTIGDAIYHRKLEIIQWLDENTELERPTCMLRYISFPHNREYYADVIKYLN